MKNSMVESFNRISSSMSAVMGGSNSTVRQPGHPTGRGVGAAGPRGPGMGRGAGKRGSRGGGMGPGRGVRNSPGRPYTQNINTAQQNYKATPAKKAQEKKQKKKKQKKGKDTGKVKTESTVRKKMVVVHFTTRPCEPNSQ